uniref:Uncharacterized protein n=1 Tax=Hippocampus comes TaxID=109280 RepID=A0A3Q3DEW3_HIPCM
MERQRGKTKGGEEGAGGEDDACAAKCAFGEIAETRRRKNSAIQMYFLTCVQKGGRVFHVRIVLPLPSAGSA